MNFLNLAKIHSKMILIKNIGFILEKKKKRITENILNMVLFLDVFKPCYFVKLHAIEGDTY